MDKTAMRIAMTKHHDTQETLAEALEMQVSGLNARINGKVDFRAGEILRIVKRYNLSPEETTEIFFNEEAS